jgi:hypothetical protein
MYLQSVFPKMLCSTKAKLLIVVYIHIYKDFFLLKLPPYTLSGFDLMTHSSSLLGGRCT